MGDFNIARHDADVFDIAAFAGSTHVTPDERAQLESIIDWGLVDVAPVRARTTARSPTGTTGPGCSTRTWACGSTTCWPAPDCTVTDAYVDREARKGKLPSDHAPVIVDLEL